MQATNRSVEKAKPPQRSAVRSAVARRPRERAAGMLAMQASDVATSGPRPISQWPTGEKLIALTYDDGPNPAITPRLLQLLQARGARATFFLLGDSVKAYPHLVKTIVDAGMEVGNHSDTHPLFTKLGEEKIRSELETNHQRVVAVAPNAAIRVMRPPYGAYNSTVLRVANQLGYKVILWSVDTNDWRKRTTEQMTQTVLSEARDGAIILMHDRYETSLQTTANVLEALSAQGYRFVTVSELLSHPRAAPSLSSH